MVRERVGAARDLSRWIYLPHICASIYNLGLNGMGTILADTHVYIKIKIKKNSIKNLFLTQY